MNNEIMNNQAVVEEITVNPNAKFVLLGLGNCGSRIVEEAATRSSLKDVDFYAIDSVAPAINMANVNTRVNYIPIIADEKSGSGRNRERGAAMFEYHEELGTFEDMLEACVEAKTPVIVITSAAGGTGSGSTPKLCKTLAEMEIPVIPIIICPSMDDPTAYQLNTTDLFMDLEECGVKTYGVFRNVAGDSNYAPINKEVVDMIEIIFGKKYGQTNLDSIDDSDLDNILATPGRFVAVSAKANDITNLTRQITRKMFTGFQPSWTDEDARQYTFMSAYSLKSMFAGEDFKQVFDEVRSRIHSVFDEYRHIEQVDNGGEVEATVIIAGLPRPELKIVDTDFTGAGTIGSGMKKSVRPNFLGRKKATFGKAKDGKPTFNWGK